ncbi:ethylmalonyl-CoA decarboxylase isoform X2 [Bemisia tabaci]|uniref:ethylmalonyl-CoA decarboxylase isoform X2 n=1 Tax=Bemisia tabaci TaxID=7038 RepID=UPI0008F9A87A|nr:PREDICTED: ethylmalonyl-CoA decarboxylase-like isoform X2 [Bemisia tabaci]
MKLSHIHLLPRKMVHHQFNVVEKYGFNGPATPLPDIVEWLSRYGEGSVDLIKNSETGIAHVTLNQVKKKNCLSGKMMVDFYHIVEDLEQWTDGKGIILSGAGGTFCSGGDLDVVRQIANPESGFKMASLMHYTLNKLKNLPLISVCFISGAGAIGGGAEVATACDYRLMSNEPNTKIGFVHSKMGIAPAWGGLLRLVDIVGSRQALDLLLSARLLSCDEACSINLVDSQIDSLDSVNVWLQDKVKFDKESIRAIKLTLSACSEKNRALTELEQRLFAPTWGCAANREMLRRAIKHK